MYDNAKNEVFSQTALIQADADEERKNEMASIQTIHLLGKEARLALIQMIEVIFNHIVEGLLHLLTNEEGQCQVIMIIFAGTSLVFAISFSKEMIAIIFNAIIRIFSMPRLVREWGCIVA